MKQLYLVANWKSNKTVEEAQNWILQLKFSKKSDNLTIILCAPYTILAVLKYAIGQSQLPISLGAQTVSSFPNGAYTGEISAQMLKGLVEHVIIGHSERRKYFNENDTMLFEKTGQAKLANMKIIYCVENWNMFIPPGVSKIAYEPVTAIGSGKAEDPNTAEDVCRRLKEKHRGIPILYGGSVTSENIVMFLKQPSIDGALVGGASLDALQFAHLVDAVSSYE